MATQQTVNTATQAVGFALRPVVVSQVLPDQNLAIVIDKTRTEAKIPLLTQRAKGRIPKEGETWLIDRALGNNWSFAAYIGSSADDFLITADDLAPGVIPEVPPPYDPSPYRPVVTNQAHDGSMNISGSFVNYSNTNWPYANFTAPPSGRVKVTISAALQNNSTTTSTCRLSWQMDDLTNGTNVEMPNIQKGLLGMSNVNPGSYTKHYTLTPGHSYQIIPSWYLSSLGGTSILLQSGQLIIDPIP